jgi:hypothetical protein
MRRLLSTIWAVAGSRSTSYAFKAASTVPEFGERPRQHPPIDNRLGSAVRADRVHGMRGVAQERDAPEAPALERVAVAHRVLVEDRRPTHQGGHVESVEAPAREVR